MKNVFNSTDTGEFINRINRLTPLSKPKWGKMNVAQMLAHCNVTYELIYENKYDEPNAFERFFLKAFVKKKVVSTVPYKKSVLTAPAFMISDEKDFEAEKKRLITYMLKTQVLGEKYFDGKKSHSFGKLSIEEWNNMLAKHLDHHLAQFGV